MKKTVFVLGSTSRQSLVGVHPDLIKVVERSIELSDVDFRVFEGTRTKEKQMQHYKNGVSRTVNGSRHLVGNDGYSHAVDLVPWVNSNGRMVLSWNWDDLFKIAEAVRTAAQELNVSIRWGGNWDVLLNETTKSTYDVEQEYVASRRAQGKSAFVDGPHFELPLSDKYPQF